MASRVWPFLLLSLAGCLHSTAPLKASTRQLAALACVVDPEHQGPTFEAPPPVKRRVIDALNGHNFEVQEAALPDIVGKRFSEERFQALKAAAAPFAFLLELRASFVSQHDGRYRWNVAGKVTAAPKDGPVVVETFTLPALLERENERENEALASVADEIARRVSVIANGLLASRPVQAHRPAADSIYFVMVDRFANGDRANDGAIDLNDPSAFHGGDLQGVIDHLDWLESLGLRTVWLSPVFKMRTEKFDGWGAFHGYWTYDLNQIEPKFGDEAKLVELSHALHSRGMRLVLDWVVNHVGPSAPLEKQHPEWFHHRGGITDFSQADQVLNHDVHGLPDLAQERDEVYAYLLAAAKHWLEVAQPDGFRLDAVKHAPLSFWKRYNDDLRRIAGRDLVLLGELLDGSPADVARTQREGGFSAMFDFPLGFASTDVFCRAGSVSKLGAVLTQDADYENPSSLVTLLDNHDLARVMSSCSGDVRKVESALRFSLAMRGTPSFIWGTEVGLAGSKDPLNRADMRFVEHPLRQRISELLQERARHPALSSSRSEIVDLGCDATQCDQLAVARFAENETALIVVNESDSEWAPQLDDGLKALWGSRHAAAHAVEWWVEPRGVERASLSEREVVFKAHAAPDGARVVGSSGGLGSWSVARAPTLAAGVASVRLAPGVYEYKLATTSQWESGENRVLFVRHGAGAVTVDVSWRG